MNEAQDHVFHQISRRTKSKVQFPIKGFFSSKDLPCYRKFCFFIVKHFSTVLSPFWETFQEPQPLTSVQENNTVTERAWKSLFFSSPKPLQNLLRCPPPSQKKTNLGNYGSLKQTQQNFLTEKKLK